MHYDRIEASRSDDHCDEVWIQILALEDDAVESADWILPLLIWIQDLVRVRRRIDVARWD